MLFISYSFSYKTHFPCFVYVGLQLSIGQKSNHFSGQSIIHRILNTMILNFSIRLGSFSISRGHFLSLKNTTKASRPIKLNFHPRRLHVLLQQQKNFTDHRLTFITAPDLLSTQKYCQCKCTEELCCFPGIRLTVDILN